MMFIYSFMRRDWQWPLAASVTHQGQVPLEGGSADETFWIEWWVEGFFSQHKVWNRTTLLWFWVVDWIGIPGLNHSLWGKALTICNVQNKNRSDHENKWICGTGKLWLVGGRHGFFETCNWLNQGIGIVMYRISTVLFLSDTLFIGYCSLSILLSL